MSSKLSQSDTQGPLVLTVRDLASALNIGRDAAYALCHRPDFPAIKIGNSYRVGRAALERWLMGEESRDRTH